MCGMNLQKTAQDLTIKFHFVWIRDMRPDYLVYPNEPILKKSRCISLDSFVIGCVYLFWEQVFLWKTLVSKTRIFQVIKFTGLCTFISGLLITSLTGQIDNQILNFRRLYIRSCPFHFSK